MPKVNRRLAAQLHENEVAEDEKREAEDADTNKKSKKKKGLTTEIMKDERFSAMFENKVIIVFTQDILLYKEEDLPRQ